MAGAARFTLTAGALALASAQCALATQGTFPHGYGVKSEGMGGAVLALPQDAVVGASNPAGTVWVGNRLDGGVAFLKVDNGVDFAGQTVDGSHDNDLYIIPQFGLSYQLDDKSALGVSVVGNGVGTAYSRESNIGGLTSAGSEFQQMVATFSYARKLSEQHSFGVGLLAIRQQLDIDGTRSIGLPEGRDEAYGAGVRLGWLSRFDNGLSLAASYASRGYMQKMDKFKNLLPEGGDVDLPANYGLGVSYQTGAWTFAGDLQRVLWSDVRAFGNAGVSRATAAPGATQGPGFGWRDQTVYKLGAAYQASERLTLRAGYNGANQLLDGRDGYLGLLAPAAPRRHVTLGASWKLANGHEISAAYARAFKEKVDAKGLGPDAVSEPYMGQHWLSVGYAVNF